MVKKLRETTNLFVEIMNSQRQVKRKLGPFDVNRMLNLSSNAQICSRKQRVKKKTACQSQTQIVQQNSKHTLLDLLRFFLSTSFKKDKELTRYHYRKKMVSDGWLSIYFLVSDGGLTA